MDKVAVKYTIIIIVVFVLGSYIMGSYFFSDYSLKMTMIFGVLCWGYIGLTCGIVHTVYKIITLKLRKNDRKSRFIGNNDEKTKQDIEQ